MQHYATEHDAPCQRDYATDQAEPFGLAVQGTICDKTTLHYQAIEVLSKYELGGLDLILREKKLRWYGNVEHFD